MKNFSFTSVHGDRKDEDNGVPTISQTTVSQRESFSTDRFPTTFFRKKLGGEKIFFKKKGGRIHVFE